VKRAVAACSERSMTSPSAVGEAIEDLPPEGPPPAGQCIIGPVLGETRLRFFASPATRSRCKLGQQRRKRNVPGRGTRRFNLGQECGVGLAPHHKPAVTLNPVAFKHRSTHPAAHIDNLTAQQYGHAKINNDVQQHGIGRSPGSFRLKGGENHVA
jgi:hypothetical protein